MCLSLVEFDLRASELYVTEGVDQKAGLIFHIPNPAISELATTKAAWTKWLII
jgi:hypothetical protein